MKFLDRLALKLFSIIMLVIVVVVALVIIRVIPDTVLMDVIVSLTDLSATASQVALVIAAVLVLLGIKGFFFTSKTVDKSKDGIVLENANGKLVISRESLENLIASVVKEIPGVGAITSKTSLDKNKNIIVDVTAVVDGNVMLKDVSTELQLKVKDALARTADLEISQVNIRVKNIDTRKMKALPSAEEPEEVEEENDDVEEINEESGEE